MMTPDDSDEDNSSVDSGENGTEVPRLPDWMQSGSDVAYGKTSYNSDTESEAGSEMDDSNRGTRPRNNEWMRPTGGSVPAYASARVSYTDSSDNDSVASTESNEPSESQQMIPPENDSKPRALPSLANWIHHRSSTMESTPLYSGADKQSDNGDIARDIINYQDDNGLNFRDLEQHQEVKPPASDSVPRRDPAIRRTFIQNGRPNVVPPDHDPFVDEGVVSSGPYGQGHRHGATVYDDWGLPISNPANFREGRNLCRPWLVAVNLFAICLVIGIIVHGGPASGYDRKRGRYNWLGQPMDTPETSWGFLGEELVGPIPDTETRLVGFGHHVTMNEKGNRVAIARTSGHRDKPGEVYVYSWRDGTTRKHNHPPKPGKWRLEQILTAELAEDDQLRFHAGQQHTPLAMSASGHRIAFTEGDHVFIFESLKTGDYWEQIAKVQSLDHDYEDELEAAAAAAKAAEAQPQLPASTTAPKAEVSTTTKAGLAEEHKELKSELKELNAELNGALNKEAKAGEDDDDDDDDGVEEGGRRDLGAFDFMKGGGHFGKHLAFSKDGKTLAVMGFSKMKGGYIRVFKDEKEEEMHDGHDEIKHLFEATPDIFLEEPGDSLALSGDGKTLAIGIATSDDLSNSGTHNGVVQVFKLDQDDEWYRVGQPIFGEYPMEGFGGSVSLSENGLVLAAGVAYGGGPVRIFTVEELDHFGKKWKWNQIGKTLHGSNHREHFGSQVKLNYDGTLVAVGAPGSPELLETGEPINDDMETFLHGRAYMFGYDKDGDEWMSAGHAVSAYEADAFGYSLAISGDGDRVVVGAPFRVVGDEVNVGVVEVFGTN